ncbi:MAG: helix-turn-helix domain-containing protein, partial [Nitrososphaerales archaeon]
IQMLYLLRSKQAKNRKEAARLLGVYRETIGDWLRKYERGGIEALLELKPRGGSESTLPKEVIAALKEKLADPKGFSTYHEVQRWVEQSFGINTTYWVIYYTSTQVLGARPAVARRSHVKKKKVMKKPLNRVSQRA